MGAVCSGGVNGKKSSAKVSENLYNNTTTKSLNSVKSKSFGSKNKHITTQNNNKNSKNSSSYGDGAGKTTPQRYHSGELFSSFSRELKPSSNPASTLDNSKVNQKNSFLGKAAKGGLEKAVEVLDNLGSSMSNLNAGSGFVSRVAARGNRISILAFEVANTVAKGSNFFQSLSEENIRILKKEILISEGVQQLVSKDMNVLLLIAASDKREEFDVFSREVIRFGDLCKDPQWHNLGRYFSKLDAEFATDKIARAEVESRMLELTALAQHTSELYHELHALDRFEQDYQRKIDEVKSLNLPQKGEGLTILYSELKEQRKIVKSLKRKSLWSKSLEEIMEKLVDVVTYIHQAIYEAFGTNGTSADEQIPKNSQRLGGAGLALHYATIITQIDNMASRPASLPPNTRDSLYRGLPITVKTALRSQLQQVDVKKEQLTVDQVKAEMEKTLQWLVPMATNTTKAHQGFGWVGEWANAGAEAGNNTSTPSNIIRLQTLYHADKLKTDHYILEMVAWLHVLISTVRTRDHGGKAIQVRSPTRKGLEYHAKMQRLASLCHSTTGTDKTLSQEDRDLLNKVSRRRLVPGISKSQEFLLAKKSGKVWAASRSTGTSPVKQVGRRWSLQEQRTRINILDVMDGLDTTF